MSALGSGFIGLILFLTSTTGTTPTVYSTLAKIVIYYAEIVALVFGTLHTLSYFDIICVGCQAQDPEAAEVDGTADQVTVPSL